jgi:ribose 5-phosphate isomerase RpiB
MKKILTVLWFICIFLCALTFIACISTQEGLIPARVDNGWIQYVEKAGVEPPGGFKSPLGKYIPYSTLAELKKVSAYMDYAHFSLQTSYNRLSEDDNTLYSFYKNQRDASQKEAESFQEMLFGTTGLVTLAGGILLGGTGFGSVVQIVNSKKVTAAKANEEKAAVQTDETKQKLAAVSAGSTTIAKVIDDAYAENTDFGNGVTFQKIWDTYLKSKCVDAQLAAEKLGAVIMPDKLKDNPQSV